MTGILFCCFNEFMEIIILMELVRFPNYAFIVRNIEIEGDLQDENWYGFSETRYG